MHHNPNFSKSYTGENLAWGVLKNLAFYKIYSEKTTKIEVKCTRFFKNFPHHLFSYQGPVNTLKLVLVHQVGPWLIYPAKISLLASIFAHFWAKN